MSGKKLIQHYEQLLAQDPKDVRLLQKLAEAFQKAGENIKAAATIARVAESYEHDGFFLKAVAQLKQAVKLDPERNDINLRLADVHHKLQLLSEAIAYLHIGLRNAQRKQDADTCLIASRRLTELDPTNPQLRLAYARLLLRADRKEEAKAELVAAGKLLRHGHPDLAAAADAVDLKTDVAWTESELATLNALTFELSRRTTLEQGLLQVDFERPN
ncbi:MAG: hypothetical protein Q8L14_16160 [Myxococcales bacterium]|nr:hypothetical protein [Myxococcales bacterium]